MENIFKIMNKKIIYYVEFIILKQKIKVNFKIKLIISRFIIY